MGSLPQNITQLEYTKFIADSNGKVAVRTVMGDGNATIYAIVNTGAVGNTNSLATLLSGPNQIGSVTVSNLISLNTGTNWIGLTTTAIGSAPTLYAVVNTSAVGNQNSLATLLAGPNQIGSVTISNQIELAVGTNYIGLVTATVGNTINSLLQAGTANIGFATVTPASLPALSTGTNWIGLATVNIGSSNATLYAVVNTGAVGNTNSLATLYAGPNQIGSVTVSNNPTLGSGTNYIGLASVNIGGTLPALAAGSAYIGLVTSVLSRSPLLGAGDTSALFTSTASGSFLNVGIRDSTGELALIDSSGRFLVSNVTLNASNAYIGLASVNIGGTLPALVAGSAYIGLATTVNATSTAYIGLVTAVNSNQPALVAGTAYVGLASVNIGGTLPALSTGTAWIGLASVNIGGTLPALTAGSAFIGLATTVNATSTAWMGLATVVPSFGSNVTIFSGIYSAAGAATIFVAPASNRFFLTSLHVASLGRAEVEFRSGATTIIPFTSLATTGGYVHDWSLPGYPGRAQADAFVANLGSAATISVGVSCYFQP